MTHKGVTILGANIRRLFDTRPGPAIPDALMALAMPPAAAGASREPSRSARRKLWQLEDKFHCPVVGTCLPMDDLTALAKRFRFLASRDNEFSLHVEAVNNARERTPFAEALQKLLDRRYRSSILRFDHADDGVGLRRAWRMSLEQGDVAGGFWALVTHPLTKADLRDRAYGDVHMLSHQVGAGQTADVRRVMAMGREIDDLKAQLEISRKAKVQQVLQWQEKLRAREEETAPDQQRALETLQARLQRYESGTAMVDMGRRLMELSATNERLLAVAERMRQQDSMLRQLRQESEALRKERDTLAAEREALESLFLADMRPPCQASCESWDAAEKDRQRRILCVGGRTNLLVHYRGLAQRLGITLIHHDGGQEESLSRLPDMINGADAVICPTDCVSHPAYYRLKNQCKRLGKPCLMFKGAGVSSFAAALMRVNGGEESLQNPASGSC